jgi:7,8-dihydropterin-6-yl-methyl-4-(beta-D-ribofuranosyl)aminobenzene 5'-phosphate synthase
LDEVWELTDDQVAEALGGLPAYKYHCSNLAASTLHRAITNYVFKNLIKTDISSITILVDNIPSGNFKSEHGLALWINHGDKRILFDTGQSNLILQNAKTLDIDLANTDAIVISHGHYDHTGGLSTVLNIASNAKIYLHPAATEPKFSQKVSSARYIGMSDPAKNAIQGRHVIWTAAPAYLFPGLAVTGQVPRMNDFEDVGGAFFLDENCHKPDDLLDDQTLFIESAKGLIVVLGCAHSGVVNTLDYISKLTGDRNIYAVIGGMHLLEASQMRIANTIDAFKKYGIQKIIPLHCTGLKAMEVLKHALGNKCLFLGAGGQINF